VGEVLMKFIAIGKLVGESFEMLCWFHARHCRVWKKKNSEANEALSYITMRYRLNQIIYTHAFM
jgi:hypothetical protein